MKKAIALLLALSMVFALCGCGRKPTAIFLSQSTVELTIDESTTLEYSLVPENANGKRISWQSANSKVVTVDDNGKLYAVAPGTTTVICSSTTGLMATCEVIVKDRSAIEQLNEHEKWFFDVLIEKILPSFYNSSTARIKKLGPTIGEEFYGENMFLDVEIQGDNRFGGTLYKDYCVMCNRIIRKSLYLPCQTDNGLFQSPHEWKENTLIDISKVNNALEEYWKNKGMA